MKDKQLKNSGSFFYMVFFIKGEIEMTKTRPQEKGKEHWHPKEEK